MKRNVPILGAIIGLILPFIGFGIMYLIWFHGTPLHQVTMELVANHDLAAKVFSLSILINLLPFTFYTSRRLDLTARGIFIATMLYVVFIVLIKFVW
jgi:hypothetical protein